MTVDVDLVQGLVRAQFPQFNDLECVRVAEGFDNSLWRLGDEHVARFPRRQMAVKPMENELRWLPEVARHVSIQTPLPLLEGVPSDRFAWPWSISIWIDGVPGDEITFDHEGRSARALATFLREVHVEAPVTAPHNPYRSVPLSERSSGFDARLKEITNHLDDASALALFERGRDAPSWNSPAVWLHGDFHPGNVLYQGNELVGVVDFGDLCAGDPATDLAGGLLSLPSTALNEFFRAYGPVSIATLERTIGWAAFFGVMMTSLGLQSKPSYLAIGQRALANASMLATRV